jgi:hypothetical protein
MYRTFMPDISNLNDVAMDAADEGYMRYHAESALSTENPNLIAEISSRLGPEFEGQDITVPGPAREAAIAYYTSPEAGLVGEIAKTQEYKAGVAARYQQEYATALDNLQDRMRAATGGNPYLVQGMQTLLGGTGGGAGVGTGRGGIPNLGGGGISSAAMAMNVTTPGGSGYGTDFSKLTSAQLESIGLSKKDANDLDGLEGPVKLAVKKAQLEVMRGNFTGTPEQAAQYIWEAKARAERQVQTDEALLDGLAGGQLPSTIKPVNADSDVANFDFSKLTSESLEEQMPNTQFDTASRGTSVDAWVPTEGSNVDKINSFANYLENTVIPNSDVDEIQWDLLPNSSKKGISRFMNLYEDKFENNPDMFAHFMQSFVKDPANRKNTIMSVFGKNNLEYLYKLDPDNINKFYNAYMEELEANLKPKANTDSSRTPDEVNAALAWRLLSQQTKK